MELREFHQRIYGKFKEQLYVLESTWDSFRPITKVGWNGQEFVIDDSFYKKDFFSPFYGYESQEQKQLCLKLIQETELSNALKLESPIDFWRWTKEQNVKWWNDRPIVFIDSCVSRDNQEWKKYLKYLGQKPKTLRRPFHGRSTRRLLPK
jgi:hypothetical protein